MVEYLAHWEAQEYLTNGEALDDERRWTLMELRQALASEASAVTAATEVWADGLESWVPLGQFIVQCYPPAGAAGKDVSATEEGTPPSDEGVAAAVDGQAGSVLSFWREVDYRYQLQGHPARLSEAIKLPELQSKIAAGEVTDGTMLEIEGERRTLQAMKMTFDGLEDALLMGDGAMTLDDGEHWGSRSYFLQEAEEEELCMAELLEKMMSGAIVDGTMLWTDGMADWQRIDTLIDTEPSFAEAMDMVVPAAIWYVDQADAQVEVSMAEFLGLLRRGECNEETQVFASPGMETWQRLYEVQEMLGISAAMAKADPASAAAEVDYSAIEKNMADTGLGTWKEKRHRALMQLLLSTKSKDMFSVVRKTAMASRLESMKKATVTTRNSQFKKVRLHMTGLSVIGLTAGDHSSVEGRHVAARVVNPSHSTPVTKTVDRFVAASGQIEWEDDLDISLRMVEANSSLQLTVMPWGMASVRIDTFLNDCTHALTLPLMDGTATAPSTGGIVELRLQFTLSGLEAGAAVAAARKRHGTKRRGSLVAALGGLQRSGSRKGWGLVRKQNLATAVTRTLAMSDESRSLAAKELEDKSPMGQLMRQKLASGEMSTESMTVTNTEATHDTETSFESRYKQIREQPLGGLNWLLVEGTVESPLLVGSGLGSLPEMCEHLDKSKVLFGLLRLGFGAGQFRRTKWCFFHWVGPNVSAVARGKANEATPRFLQLLAPTHVQYEAGSEEEASLPVFIAWITKIIGGDDCDYSLETFKTALDEEAALNAARPAGPADDDHRTVGTVRSAAGELRYAAAAGVLALHAISDVDEEYDSDDDDAVTFDLYGPERARKLPSTPKGAHKLIVDLGYGSTKFGMSHEIEHGPTVLHNRSTSRRDMIEFQKMDSLNVDWTDMEALWERIMNFEMELESEDIVVSCTISPFGKKDYSLDLAELLFEEMGVSSLYFGQPSVLALYANGLTTGLVIDSGTCTSSCMPVVEGHCIAPAVQTMQYGGRNVTEWLARAAGIAIDDFESMMEVQRMKEKLCLMGKPPSSSSEEFAMPDGKVVDGALVKAAQTVPAKLAFAPSKLDIEHELFGTPTQYEKGLDTLALDSLGICSIENRTELMRNTILIGGNSLTAGFESALERSMKQKQSSVKFALNKLRINAGPDRATTAWRGGCVLAQMSGWVSELTSADEYNEEGAERLHRFNILSLG